MCLERDPWERALQVGCLQQGNQFPQRWQRTTRFGAERHALAKILASHPSRYELTPLAGVNFKLLEPATAESAHNGQVFPPIEGVKRVIDGHFAQIAGISLGRAKEFLSRLIVIART